MFTLRRETDAAKSGGLVTAGADRPCGAAMASARGGLAPVPGVLTGDDRFGATAIRTRLDTRLAAGRLPGWLAA